MAIAHAAPSGYLERPRPSGLADVIDIILDKGLVIDAYVRVSLIGIEILIDRRPDRDRERRHLPALRRGRQPAGPRQDRRLDRAARADGGHDRRAARSPRRRARSTARRRSWASATATTTTTRTRRARSRSRQVGRVLGSSSLERRSRSQRGARMTEVHVFGVVPARASRRALRGRRADRRTATSRRSCSDAEPEPLAATRAPARALARARGGGGRGDGAARALRHRRWPKTRAVVERVPRPAATTSSPPGSPSWRARCSSPSRRSTRKRRCCASVVAELAGDRAPARACARPARRRPATTSGSGSASSSRAEVERARERDAALVLERLEPLAVAASARAARRRPTRAVNAAFLVERDAGRRVQRAPWARSERELEGACASATSGRCRRTASPATSERGGGGMGLITGLLTLPLAPVRGTAWLAEKLLEQAEREFYDERAIRAQLLEIEAAARGGRDRRRRGRSAPRTSCSSGCSRGGAEEDAMAEIRRTARTAAGSVPRPRDLTRSAQETIEDLTGFDAGVGERPAVGRRDVARLTVDVCELERIPNTTDVLASYVVQLDDRGGLLGLQARPPLPARPRRGGLTCEGSYLPSRCGPAACRGGRARRRTSPTSSSGCSTRASSSRATSRSTCSTSSC